jgi:transcriptional regulator with XRE-family HTH domain
MSTFGRLIRERRRELQLTLGDFAERADIDAGNLSRIENDRVAPPQNQAVLNRICVALGYDVDHPEAKHLRDVAAIQNGRIPHDIVENEEVMAQMPLLLRSVAKHRLNPEEVDRLVELIREAG